MNDKSQIRDTTTTGAEAKPMEPAASPGKSTHKALSVEEMIELARQGRIEVLPDLRTALHEHPELWQKSGNLAYLAQGALLQLISQNNLFLMESAARFAAIQREELAGLNATPLERLLVERIVATNLLVCFFESQVSEQEGSDVSQEYKTYLHARHDQATRRLLEAMTALARIRRLLPQPIKVELAVSGEVTTTVKKSRSRKSKLKNPGLAGSQRGSAGARNNRLRDFVDAGSPN